MKYIDIYYYFVEKVKTKEFKLVYILSNNISQNKLLTYL